jgi:uncharacterized protein YkwD
MAIAFRRIVLAGLATACAVGAAAPAQAATTPAPAANKQPVAEAARSHSTAGLKRQMRVLINQVRRQNGLRRLAPSRSLNGAAARKGKKIRATHQFSHTPGGASFMSTFDAAGFRGRIMGENLAFGTGATGTPQAVLAMWMASPGHRANLLNGSYRLQGLDVRAVSLPGVGRVRLWTNTFGG